MNKKISNIEFKSLCSIIKFIYIFIFKKYQNNY